MFFNGCRREVSFSLCFSKGGGRGGRGQELVDIYQINLLFYL